jgi:hypothetical protein
MVRLRFQHLLPFYHCEGSVRVSIIVTLCAQLSQDNCAVMPRRDDAYGTRHVEFEDETPERHPLLRLL